MSFANIQFSAVRSNTESINCHSLVFTYFAGESWSFKRDIYLGIETLIGHNLFQVRANFIEIVPQYACVPGATLLPDFFLDEFDNHTGGADVIKPDETEKSLYFLIALESIWAPSLWPKLRPSTSLTFQVAMALLKMYLHRSHAWRPDVQNNVYYFSSSVNLMSPLKGPG